MALFDTTWYCNAGDQSTTGHYAVAKRPQNTAVAAGQLVRQFTAPAVGSERVFVCVVAGTTANTTDATWALTRGAVTTDGTAKWQEVTGASAVNGDLTNTPTWATVHSNVTAGQIIKQSNGASYQIANFSGNDTNGSEPAFSSVAGTVTAGGGGMSWTSLGPVSNFTGGQAPHARIQNAATSNWFAAGNTIYVGDNHAESQATTITISPAGATNFVSKILCHNHFGSYPPASTDLTTGATISTTAAGASITFTPSASSYFYGLTFKAGVGVSTSTNNILNSGNTAAYCCLDNCSFWLANSAAANVSSIQLTQAGANGGIIVFNNTTIKFAVATNALSPGYGKFIWQNTGAILVSGSAVPTSLFNLGLAAASQSCSIVLEAIDLSQITGNLCAYNSATSQNDIVIKDSKLNASAVLPQPTDPTVLLQLVRSDSSSTAYKSTRYQYEGTETTETSITRVGGASDPTGQAQSRKIVTTANSQWLRPFKAEPYAIWNPRTAANVTVTVCGTVNAGALPNNDDIWLEVEYLGDSASTLGKIVTTTKANVLAANTAVASDSSTWNGTAFAAFSESTLINASLSNGNLTVTDLTTATGAGAYSSSFAATGKYYFEFTVNANFASGTHLVGALTSNGVLSDMNGNLNCLSVNKNGIIASNGSSSASSLGATIAVNDVVGIAVDLNARLGWARKNGGIWNNSGTANPATGAGGFALYATGGYAPAVYFSGATSTGSQYTFNCGQSAFANAAPSGYSGFPGIWSPFKLTTTLSAPQPGMAGYLHARVRVAKPSSTFYIDPMVVLS